jgi:hydroxymethylbilane synthase
LRKKLVVGTRGSRLARVQTGTVVAELNRLYPQMEIETRLISTSGDKDRQTQLEDMGTNIFVKELEEALLDGRIDLAVHSLKDVPTELPGGLGIVAVPQREDPRDVLVSRRRLEEMPPGAKIGTGSLRRSIQLAKLRPDLRAVGIRGNVDTRVKKSSSGELDGVILAAAGLNRLGLADGIAQFLSLDDFLPAAGQGALALEARLAERDVLDIVEPLNNAAVGAAVSAERAFLRELGGGCRAPIAALAAVRGNLLELSGLAASPDGQAVIKDRESGSANEAEETGRRLARKLLKMGADKFVDEARRLERR